MANVQVHRLACSFRNHGGRSMPAWRVAIQQSAYGFLPWGSHSSGRSQNNTTFDRRGPRSARRGWAGSFPTASVRRRGFVPWRGRARGIRVTASRRRLAGHTASGRKAYGRGPKACWESRAAKGLRLSFCSRRQVLARSSPARRSSARSTSRCKPMMPRCQQRWPVSAVRQSITQTSGLLDEEPSRGFNRGLAVLMDEGGVDVGGQNGFLADPKDPPLQIGTNHVSRHQDDEPIAGPGGLAFVGQILAIGRLQDLLPEKDVARLGMQLYETQRRGELSAGRSDREHEEPPAIPERIAGRRP